ncbi:MAG: LysR family transcriptional regulator [Mycolicibacterium rufum]|uniref:Probable hydrogen peroxide-inducible genes activator n=1 Tax=Mycolicibacterium chlorophenolicum TaxID=37916 RepID=A0A0J6VGW8_9MYCO|nr:LysR family transcriptional regulator [Mycolicibacterium chlorophenolicum]KMO70255.1 Hca operon transcriptional activator [Mycolicibacterium chlorophenolicum]MBI5338429.1 LysR family transcriptional regulator [Mycolicibacterium rufum]
MDLIRHLRYFVAVAEHRHFGHAAASLGVTQPPVSQGLRRLERHLGLELVERTPAGATLTDAGAALLPRARLIVDDSTRLLSDAAELYGSLRGVRWGVIPQLDDELLARCTRALRAALGDSGAPLTTVTKGTTGLLTDLRRGSLDVAVVAHPVVVAELDAGPVITLHRNVVLPAGHRAAEATNPRVPMLRGLALAAAPRDDNPPAHDLLIDALRRRGLDMDHRAASTHRDVSAAVAAGQCFGLATPTATVHAGTFHRRMLVDDVSLRVRIVTAPGRKLTELIHAVDRELLRTRQ